MALEVIFLTLCFSVFLAVSSLIIFVSHGPNCLLLQLEQSSLSGVQKYYILLTAIFTIFSLLSKAYILAFLLVLCPITQMGYDLSINIWKLGKMLVAE